VTGPRFREGKRPPRREPAPAHARRANLGRGFEEAAIYHGGTLQPGDVVRAPAVIEETFTTIAVYPGWEARVDDAGTTGSSPWADAGRPYSRTVTSLSAHP
jgi:N-methylhydantoinase A